MLYFSDAMQIENNSLFSIIFYLNSIYNYWLGTNN